SGTTGIRNLVDLQPVQPPAIGKDEHITVGVSDEDIRDRVFLFRLHADSALAASSLLSINRKRSSFDVAAMCDGDDGVFLGNQILEPDLGRFLSNLSPPRSEEHTSELQSRFDLVCRLLLEKKKKINLII